METRDEWIEREAKAARERWRGLDPWESLGQNIRDDWRKVVAPFYDLHVRAGEARPVKVRFDVTAEDLAAKVHYALHGGWPELSQEGDRTKAAWIDTAKIAMDYLAAHAVIDVPAGVPNDQQLAEIIYEYVRTGRNFAESELELTQAVVAVRDAILAAMPQPREWSEEDVEGLARAMCDATHAHAPAFRSSWLKTPFRNTYRAEARAALQWMAERAQKAVKATPEVQ